MTVKCMKIFLILAILLVPSNTLGAEAIKFRYITSAYSDDKGIAIEQPEGVECHKDSQFFLADTGNNRLLRFILQGKELRVDHEIKIPQLSSPIRVQVNTRDEIYALDGMQRRIVRLNSEGKFLNYLNPSGLPNNSTFVARSFRLGSQDNIYLLDIFSERVLVLGTKGEFQKQIEFPNGYGFFSDLTVDSQDNIFIVDSIRKVVFVAAKNALTFSQLTNKMEEYVTFPTAIATDNRGTIFVVDKHGSAIAVLGQDGSYLGQQLTMGWNEGLLYYPTQLCVNENAQVFLADRGNNRVQMFSFRK